MVSILKQARHEDAHRVLKELGWTMASTFGWHLWGADNHGGGEGSHKQNKFCRSAGKLLKQLKARGMAEDRFTSRRHEWRAI